MALCTIQSNFVKFIFDIFLCFLIELCPTPIQKVNLDHFILNPTKCRQLFQLKRRKKVFDFFEKHLITVLQLR
jgi:hypothetical protein